MTDNGPAVVAGPILCPGSGAWAGWGWAWRSCPECHARIDVDETTLTIKPHAEKIDDWLRARTGEGN
jgi:hypothetical protein